MSGISYLSREQEREAIRILHSTYDSEWSDVCKLKDVRDIPLVSMAEILFTERMKNKFSEWRDGLLQKQNREDQIQGISKDSKQQFQVIFFKMHPALRLTGFTSRQLKLIQLVMLLYLVLSVDMFTFFLSCIANFILSSQLSVFFGEKTLYTYFDFIQRLNFADY